MTTRNVYVTRFSFRALWSWLGFSMTSTNVRSNSSFVCATYRICCSPSTRLFTLMIAQKSRAVRQRSAVLTVNKHDLPLVIRISPPPTLPSAQKPPSHITNSTSPGNRKHTHTGHVLCIWTWSVNVTRYTITSNINRLFPVTDILPSIMLPLMLVSIKSRCAYIGLVLWIFAINTDGRYMWRNFDGNFFNSPQFVLLNCVKFVCLFMSTDFPYFASWQPTRYFIRFRFDNPITKFIFWKYCINIVCYCLIFL